MSHEKRIRTSAGALAIAAAAMLVMTGVARAADWTFSVMPYGWLTDVGVDATLGRRQIIEKEIPVSDLVEDLEMIFQVRLEAQREEFGAMVDFFNVELSDEKNGIPLRLGEGTADARAGIGMTIIDVQGLYDPKGDRQGIAILAGTRILSERADVDVTVTRPIGPSGSDSYEYDEWRVDGLAGARYTYWFTEHWGAYAHADASTGGTDYTWSVSPAVNYAFGERGRFTVQAGYRYMEIDFEGSDDLEPKMSLSGALIGFRIGF